MKKFVCIIVAVIILGCLCSCGTTEESSVKKAAEEYAKKHAMECFTPEDLAANGIVGQKYVVYGNVSYIFFSNYTEDSEEYADMLESFAGIPDGEEYVRLNVLNTLYYYINLDGKNDCDLIFEDSNNEYNWLKINEGDDVAFLVLCEDGYSAGTYEYEVIDMIAADRKSTTTVEEDHAAKKLEE